MKTNKTISYLLLTALVGILSACDLNYRPDDELSTQTLLGDKNGAKYIMDGCYATLKDQVDYLGYASGNAYVRHYFQMAEFPADNVCLAGKTTDPLYNALALMMTDNLKNVGTLWMLAYKVINMSNTVIENSKEGEAETNQLIGEAYYMRALMHLHMVTLYAKPYSFGRENMGVPLRLTTQSSTTQRNQVGAVYDQIVKDLEKAAKLMTKGAERGNKGYPSHMAALGLLTRVYLYMNMPDKVLSITKEMLNGEDPANVLDENIGTYFANAKTSRETLFCIAHETTDDKGQASGGSMYNGDGGGWGEIYPSDPLLYLYERYPEDKRYAELIAPQYLEGGTGYKISFASPMTPSDESGRQNLTFVATPEGDSYTFSDGTRTYPVEKRLVQGEYYVYYVNYGGEELMARITTPMTDRYNYSRWYVRKFGYQDGIPTLSSPVMQRWAEVLLNAAEAHVALNQEQEALVLVNTLRRRAGIKEEGMFYQNQMHGYTSVKQIVQDERRLELAFEGHRLFDMMRYEQNFDRHYPGAQPWGSVSYSDQRLQYPIPYSEWSVSGIQQNPGY